MLLLAGLSPKYGLKHRALIYDGKQEYYPMLVGMGVSPDAIHILNPADARCTAWNLAGDVFNRDDAVNLTSILIPDDKKANENPFFILAVRAIVSEVIVSLHALSPNKWRLIDVVNAVRTPDILKRVLKTSKEGEELIERYFTEAKEAVGGIISTLDARFISQYETIARVWARCHKTISLTQWVDDHSVLLLGFDANRQSVDRINQAIFQRASQLLCSKPEAGKKNLAHSWVILDEVRFTGKLPLLPELISFGRTKNVHVVLAPQDVDGLTDVYGENQTTEMLGLCGNIGILRLTSPKTREWAAKLFGDYESWEIEKGYTVSRGGSSSGSGGGSNWNESWSSTTRRVKRESILPSEFFTLPVTNRINGMHGFFATPTMGAWRAEIPTGFIDDHLPPNDAEAPPFVARPHSAVDPMRWSSKQETKFTTPPAESKQRPAADPPKQPPKKPPKDINGADPLPEW